MNSDLVKSPFKFLDPYNKSDRKFFFGRNNQIKQLYDFVNKNRLVLVYGVSGTGKTSIIQCGLASEFDATDWKPYFIRRGDNLNETLAECIKIEESIPSVAELKELVNILFDENENSNESKDGDDSEILHDEKILIAKLIYNLQKTTAKYLRPVYLIFDQFEELLILASENEKKLFVKSLKIILGSNSIVDCHIIIVLREEYFAWLDNFENDIPGLSDRRLRIEVMRINDVRSVILDSFKEFSITLEDPTNNVNQIIEALAYKGDVTLPYLQVYLDQLWRKDYEKTYPDGYKGNQKYIPLTFTTEEIKEFGEIKDVLQRFLIESKNLLEQTINSKFEKIPENFVSQLLDCFVNDRGTKLPNSYIIENGFYKFKRKSAKFLRETDSELLKFSLDFFHSRQILRNEGNTFEFGHDILAKLIYKQRDAKQRKISGIRVMLSMHKQSGEIIPYDLVRNWEKYIDFIDLKEEEKAFFEECKSDGEKKEFEKISNEEISKALEKKELEIKLTLEKKENEYKIATVERKNMVKKRLIIFSIFLIGALLFNYWDSLKIQNSYYGMEVIRSLDTISDKMDALWLAKFVYDFKEYEDNKKLSIESKMKSIASTADFAKLFSKYNYTLKSSAALLNGLEIDISGNGKFISVMNDSMQILIDVESKKLIDSFPNVSYSYFLNSSDTLLLALSDRNPSMFWSFYSNKILIYDCSKGKAGIDTIEINKSSYTKYLYDKEYLNRTNYTNWDSYKVRLFPFNKLVIPFFDLKSDKRLIMILDLITKERKLLFENNSIYSMSISRQADKVLYGYEIKDETILEVYDKDENKYYPVTGARYADFTENGLIVFTKQNSLFICTDKGLLLKKFNSKNPINRVLAGGDENFALALDQENKLNLIDFRDSSTLEYDESLIGYNFRKETFITTTIDEDSFISKKPQLTLRNFNGSTLKTILCKYGIESAIFNENANNILLKSKKLPTSNLQLLYLYDDTLGLKATFFITANDSYGFSKDGKSLFILRDNELSVYDNKKYLDLSDFNSVNTWLDNEKKKDGDNFDSKIKKLRIKYGIRKFPTQTLGFSK